MQLPYTDNKEFQQDPIAYLARVTGLESFLPQLRNTEEPLYLLSGLILYRSLPQNEKIKLMRAYTNLENKGLVQKFRSTAANLVVNPYNYPWSLNDQELRDAYEIYKDVFSTASELSLGSALLNPSAKDFAVFLLNSSKGSIKSAVSEHTKSALNTDISNKIFKSNAKKIGSIAMATVTFTATFVAKLNDISMKQSKIELNRRHSLKDADF